MGNLVPISPKELLLADGGELSLQALVSQVAAAERAVQYHLEACAGFAAFWIRSAIVVAAAWRVISRETLG